MELAQQEWIVRARLSFAVACCALAMPLVPRAVLAADPVVALGNANAVPRSARQEVAIGASYSMRAEERNVTQPAVMLREVRAIELEAGRRTLEWLELPQTAVVETVQVSLAAPVSGVRVVGVRVVEPQLSQAALSAALRGAPVVATATEDESRRRRGLPIPAVDSGPQVSLGGAIVSTTDGLVLRVGKELTVLPPSTVRADVAVPGRRLFVEVEVAPGTPRSRVGLQLDALVEKVVFHAPHYVLQLDASGTHARLTGSILVSNVSGYPLQGAQAFYARPDASLPMRGYSRRDSEGVSGVAETWAPALAAKAPPPFAFAGPMVFGPSGVADVPVIAASDLPVTVASRVVVADTSHLTERTSDPSSVAPTRTFSLDVSALRDLRGANFPRGPVVLLSASSAGPAQPAGEGSLRHDPYLSKAVVVEAQVPPWLGLNVTATVLAPRRAGKCTMQSSVRYEVPSALLEQGPFEVRVPFPKKTVAVTLPKEAQRAGITLTVDEAGTTVSVPARAAPAAATGQVFTVQYRVQDCDG